MPTRMLVCFVILLAVGCGSKGFAPVSGKIMLDNKPLADASVVFTPVPDKGSIDAGIGSLGSTNENGEFTLTGTNGQTGAKIGLHRVSITKHKAVPAGASTDTDDRRGAKATKNEVPEKYSEKTTLTFEVKPGNNQADFLDLTSK